MFSKSLAAASNNYLRLKVQLGDRRPSLVGEQTERRPSVTGQQTERRPSLAGQQTERRSSIANPQGTCHRSMMELQEHLGRAGTTTEAIEHLMGPPTKVLSQPDEVLSYELKRNNEKYEYPQNAKIWIYQWRGNHDYVYFIISNENKVIQSAWYYAFE